MSKIERYSNWCSYDRLDGKDVVDGERLTIAWPNGAITTERVWIDKRPEGSYADCSGSHDIPTSHAYVLINHFGVSGRVYIVGLTAMRATR